MQDAQQPGVGGVARMSEDSFASLMFAGMADDGDDFDAFLDLVDCDLDAVLDGPGAARPVQAAGAAAALSRGSLTDDVAALHSAWAMEGTGGFAIPPGDLLSAPPLTLSAGPMQSGSEIMPSLLMDEAMASLWAPSDSDGDSTRKRQPPLPAPAAEPPRPQWEQELRPRPQEKLPQQQAPKHPGSAVERLSSVGQLAEVEAAAAALDSELLLAAESGANSEQRLVVLEQRTAQLEASAGKLASMQPLFRGTAPAPERHEKESDPSDSDDEEAADRRQHETLPPPPDGGGCTAAGCLAQAQPVEAAPRELEARRADAMQRWTGPTVAGLSGVSGSEMDTDTEGRNAQPRGGGGNEAEAVALSPGAMDMATALATQLAQQARLHSQLAQQQLRQQSELQRLIWEQQREVAGQQGSGTGAAFVITEVSPDWDWVAGGSKVLIIGQLAESLAALGAGPGQRCGLQAAFDGTEVPCVWLQPGVLACRAPPHAAGHVSLCVTLGDGTPASALHTFEFRRAPPGGSAPAGVAQVLAEPSDREFQLRLVEMLISRQPSSSGPRLSSGISSADERMVERALFPAGAKHNAGSELAISGADAKDSDVERSPHPTAAQQAARPRIISRLRAAADDVVRRVLFQLIKRRLEFAAVAMAEARASAPGIARAVQRTSQCGLLGTRVLGCCAALGLSWAVHILAGKSHARSRVRPQSGSAAVVAAAAGTTAADVDETDLCGVTPLHWAAARGREECVVALLACGADPLATCTLCGRAGLTPADVASACRHLGIAAYLSEAALARSLCDLELGVNAQRAASALPRGAGGKRQAEVAAGMDSEAEARGVAAAAEEAAIAIQTAFRQYRLLRVSAAALNAGQGATAEKLKPADSVSLPKLGEVTPTVGAGGAGHIFPRHHRSHSARDLARFKSEQEHWEQNLETATALGEALLAHETLPRAASAFASLDEDKASVANLLHARLLRLRAGAQAAASAFVQHAPVHHGTDRHHSRGAHRPAQPALRRRDPGSDEETGADDEGGADVRPCCFYTLQKHRKARACSISAPSPPNS